MSVDVQEEKFKAAELFGKPVLFANVRVDPRTVSNGFYRYELRGADNNTGDFSTLEQKVRINHADTILTRESFDFNGKKYLPMPERRLPNTQSR